MAPPFTCATGSANRSNGEAHLSAWLQGFAPIAARNARILILGSMPGAMSLERAEYYAHPRNAFWDIVGALFEAGRDKPYATRAKILKANGIALWDVLDACVRPGSLDADIRDAEPNDFAAFFAEHRHVERIAFNGGAAAKLFRRHVEAPLDISLIQLPSTSPAHAARSFKEKCAAWRRALKP